MPVEPLKFDHYEVPLRADGTLWELGRGAMGITYKAFDTRLRVEVVLKIIKQDLLTSERVRFLFLREARAAAKVRHPNIAAVITLHDQEPFYYTMEFVAGRSLADQLKLRGALPPVEALDCADQIAAALGAMAREHIVHRDLKPANIMVVPDEDRPFGNLLKVIDFGLAKGFRADNVDPDSHLLSLSNFQSGFSGTVAYASPEQCAESPEIDGRSDLYSVGVMLWQMLSGKLPFNGTLGQISAMHQTKEPPWAELGATPEPVVTLLRKMLAKELGDRFATARDLRDAIAKAFPLLGPDHDRRRAERAATETAMSDPNMETQVAATVHDTVRLGTTVAERYTVGEMLAEGDGGKLFKAADNREDGTLAAMKLLDPRRAKDEAFCALVRDELGKVTRQPQPVFLKPATGLQRSGESTFYVREWAHGFSLEELLRARGGEVRAGEVWRMLHELPAALDLAATENLTLAEPLLRKLFVCPSPEATDAKDWPALCSRPVAEWPDFRLRWNTISFRPAEGRGVDAVTQIQGVGDSAKENPVRALALLVRELLGGRVGTLTPLPALGDEANAVLQRALVPAGTVAFANARGFWDALATTPVARAAPRSPADAAPVALPAAALVSVESKPTVEPASAAGPSKRGPFPRWVIFGVAALVVAGAGAAWFMKREGDARKQKEQAQQVAEARDKAARDTTVREQQEQDRVKREKDLQAQLEKEKTARLAAEKRADDERKASAARAVPTATPAPAPAASVIRSATRAQPFVNSLGMKFVPVTGVNGLFSVWKTRVVDFQAFCDGRPYTQQGGISTRRIEKNDKGGYETTWKLDANASWKEPGFPQSANHPVVGVSWNEAKRFCDWLTTKDRAAGKIGSDESYRLPTDAEWSTAVGTGKYPWGDEWPPPKGAGNYLDSAGVAELPASASGWGQVPGSDGYAFTSPVGTFNPNAYGLYDLGGNAWECCEDEYRADLNDEETKKAFPTLRNEPASGATPFRVQRGASWSHYVPGFLRSAYRFYEQQAGRSDRHGFRVVLVSASR